MYRAAQMVVVNDVGLVEVPVANGGVIGQQVENRGQGKTLTLP